MQPQRGIDRNRVDNVEKKKKEEGEEADRAASLPVTPAAKCRNSSGILIAENRSRLPESVDCTGIS